MYKSLIDFIRSEYQTGKVIPLHAPLFKGNERKYLIETIDSSFVSSIGAFVNKFETEVMKFTQSESATATMNGTAALHICLSLSGVKQNDLVITQALTFVASCNAINYCGAEPLFIDVDLNRLSLCPQSMENWLLSNAYLDLDGNCRTIKCDRIIRACLPMHTFGIPANLDGLTDVCNRWSLNLIEDAAESLGSFYKGKHTGTIANMSSLSFNGNKIITTGGGGMILATEPLGFKAKHLTTTAKKAHKYEFFHDEIGYNYRMPNLNAAVGCAQIESLENFLIKKRELAFKYLDFFKNSPFKFITEPSDSVSNYWLNGIICDNKKQRDELLEITNENGIMTRPVWTLMSKLPMFSNCLKGSLKNSLWLESRVVNLPSSVPKG